MGLDFYNVPIVDYLLMINEPIIKVGNQYYQHRDHDSLKINARKNYFVWNSRSAEVNSSGGVIQYLQIVLGLTLAEALAKVEADLKGIEIKPSKIKLSYPKYFNYRVKEVHIPLEAQKYLVAKRRIPNNIVRFFFSRGLVSQNENQEIIFKWYKKDSVVGFSKQGTVPLTSEDKERFHYKRDYFKYVSPTTEENTFWGFNYGEGLPENVFVFESEIDLISYFALYHKKLNNFWLVSINGVALKKLSAIMDYAVKNMDLKLHLKNLVICYDNDKAGNQAWKEVSAFNLPGINIINGLPNKFKDWNEVLQNTL
ncbi:TPA: toprim domain-containing protein [Streptococcus pyogenes]